MPTIGCFGSHVTATVDDRGAVTTDRGWSLDWWVGAEDRWHLPRRETAVRHAQVGHAPVAETLMRVPGGDAACLAYVVVEGGCDVAVVEVDNRSAAPVVVAFVVSGAGAIALDEERVDVDGQGGLLLPRPPSAAVADARDVADLVVGNRAVGTFESVRSTGRTASAAFVYPLSHRSAVRIALPLDGRSRVDVSRLAPASAVVDAWAAQMARGLRADLPAGRLADALAAARLSTLLAFGPHPTPAVAASLDRFGYHREAVETLARLWVTDDGHDRGPLLRASALHWELTRDEEFLERVVAEVLRGAPRLASEGCAAAAVLLRAAGDDRAARRLERRASPAPHVEHTSEAVALLLDDSGSGVSLLPELPAEWHGQSLDVHDAPTRHGRVSFAVRWHGERPALLWDCERPTQLTAPGLDPAWSSAAPAGEGLLRTG